MKIAYFHTNTIRSSWTLWAAAQSMTRIGHQVLDCAVPTDLNGRLVPTYPQGTWSPFANCRSLPPIEEVLECDRVIVMAPEYCDGWLERYYGTDWRHVKATGIFVESTRRPDMSIDLGVMQHYPDRYWPDPDDVVRYGGQLMQPFVDTEMFHEPCCDIGKEIPVGFMGTLYRKRVEFLQDVKTPIWCSQVSAYSMMGEAHRAWTELYRQALWSMKIHVDLPSNNPMPTSRPYETMAAGTCLVTWAVLPPVFVPGRHYLRYTSAAHLDSLLRGLLRDDGDRAAIASMGWSVTHQLLNADAAWRKIIG